MHKAGTNVAASIPHTTKGCGCKYILGGLVKLSIMALSVLGNVTATMKKATRNAKPPLSQATHKGGFS
jgi:hypothetical protein